MATKDASSKEIKIVVVGDGTVGKTCLLSVFGTDEFAFEHIPTIFENKQIRYNYGGCEYILDLWDTAGQENFDRLRPLSYKEVDAFLVCFNCVDSNSLDNVRFKWKPELEQYAPETPMILVGTKSDLIKDPSIDPNVVIKKQSINDVMKACHMLEYVETSALERHNYKKPFEKAIDSVDGAPKSTTGCCVVL